MFRVGDRVRVRLRGQRAAREGGRVVQGKTGRVAAIIAEHAYWPYHVTLDDPDLPGVVADADHPDIRGYLFAASELDRTG